MAVLSWSTQSPSFCPERHYLRAQVTTLCKKGDMQSEERKVTVQITFLIQTSKEVKSPWAPVTEVSVL